MQQDQSGFLALLPLNTWKDHLHIWEPRQPTCFPTLSWFISPSLTPYPLSQPFRCLGPCQTAVPGQSCSCAQSKVPQKKKTITWNILKRKESCGAFISHTVTQYDHTIGHDFWFQTSPCFLHTSSFDTSRSEICQVTAAARCETSFLHLGDLCRVWWRYVHPRVATSTVCGFAIAWGMNKYGKIRRQSGANPPSLTQFLWVSKLEGTQWLRPFWAKTRPRDTKFPCGA